MKNKPQPMKKTADSPFKRIPKLRFPEFRDSPEWEVNSLERICSKVTQGGTPSTSNEEYWGGNINWITPAEMGKTLSPYISESVRKITQKGLSKCSSELLPSNSVIISTRAPIGLLAINSQETAINQGCKGLILKKSNNHKYLYYSLLHNNWRLNDLGAGNTFKELTANSLKQFKIPIPSLPEQQRIADCLSSLDEWIAAEAQRLDAFKDHKKGLMQQLFPCEGETTPQLRFPEFQNAPEWEEKSIGKKLKLLSGYPFKSSEITEDSRGIPLLRGINITEGYIRHNKDIDRYYVNNIDGLEKYLLRENDLVIGMDGSKVGKNSALISSSDSGSLLIQRVARLRGKCINTVKFIFMHVNSYRFHAYVDSINTSGGIPHISAKQINDWTICFPPTEQELVRVTECLSSLEQWITSQTNRVAFLKAHKKGLMQQLFPSGEEGNV